MNALELDAVEARVLGVLMEKEATTPDAYPLSVNALTAGCNQKSNRDPVMSLGERAVTDALDNLVRRSLVREAGSAGGRARRFAHRLDSRLFGTLEFSPPERAVLCVLLLRGAQTPGEIRARCGRLHAFDSLDAVESVLARLAAREDGPFVAALPREPGRREVRHMELLSAAPAGPPAAATAPAPAEEPAAAVEGDPPTGLGERVAALEARVEALEARLAAAGAPGMAPAPDPAGGGATDPGQGAEPESS